MQSGLKFEAFESINGVWPEVLAECQLIVTKVEIMSPPKTISPKTLTHYVLRY